MGSCSELGEFDDVVGVHAVSAPDSGAGVTGETGAPPAAVAFEVTDAALASGTPFHGGYKGGGMLDGLPGGGWFAGTGDHDGAHTEIGEVVVDTAVAAVGGDHLGCGAEQLDDTRDCGCEEFAVVRVADMNGVVDDQTIAVVGDLGFVTVMPISA